MTDMKMCGRCLEEVAEVFLPTTCTEKPEDSTQGMYHCPDCGAMLMGRVPHPMLCKRCLNREHPSFDPPTFKPTMDQIKEYQKEKDVGFYTAKHALINENRINFVEKATTVEELKIVLLNILKEGM